jgi:Flp pilus assembly pilin Flp
MTWLRRGWTALVGRWRDRERGATAVEYALLVGLFAVAIIGAVDALQGSAADRLESQSATAAQPSELNGHFGPRGSTPTGGQPGVTTPDPSPVQFSSIALGGGASSGQGQRWNASVTITASDPDGNRIPGVIVLLGWTGGETGEIELITGADGQATHEVTGIHQNSSLTFTVLGVFAEGHVFETLPSLTLSKGS